MAGAAGACGFDALGEGVLGTGPHRSPQRVFDFDTVEYLDLDRFLHAIARYVRLHRAKVGIAACTARRSAAGANICVPTYESGIVEPEDQPAGSRRPIGVTSNQPRIDRSGNS